LPLRFATGWKYEYCNTNYVLLALIVQRVAHKSFGAFLHDEIFVPAGMKTAFLYEVENGVPCRATFEAPNAIGYDHGKNNEPYWKPTWGLPPYGWESLVPMGDGGIWCNLEDLAKWDAALRAGKFLKPETWKLALTPSHTGDGKKNDYGFGWSLYFNKAGSLIGYGHRGLWRSFRANYYDYVLKNRTTVILTNRADFDPDKFWYALDDVVEKYRAGK
jgi:CubicO group peptidase (beta-lactamase class C family)